MRKEFRLEDIGIYERIILKWIFGKYGLNVWIRFVWFRVVTGGGLLLIRQ
jgi:hypothetical protein